MDAAVKMRLATTASAEPRSTVRPHTIRLTERTTCPVCGRECPVVEITEHASACAHRRFGEGPRPPPPEKEKRTLQLEAAAVAEALLAEVFADTDCEAQSTGGEAPLYAHNESTQLIGAGASSEGRSTSHVKGGSWYARKRARKVARDVEELDNLLIKSSRVDLLGPSHPLLAAVHARRPPARQSPPAPTAQVAAPPTPPTATSPPPGPAASSEPPSSAPTPAPTTAPTTATTTPMAGALSAAGTASIEGAASTAATAAASALMAASSHTRQLSGCIMNGAGATGAAAPMDAVATHSSEVLPHGQPAPRSTSPLLLPPRAAHSSGEDGGEGARSSAATHGARVLGAGIWGVGRGGAEVDRWLTASKRWRPEPPRLVVVTAQRLPAAAAGGGGTAQSVPLGTWEQPLVAGALTLPTALPITPPMPAEATAAHVRSADAQQPVAQPSARAVAPEPRAGEGAGAAAPSRLAKGGTVVLRKSGEPRANKQRWTKAEDQMLRDAVAAEGPHNWSLIAEALPGRNEKQARERWVSQLRPDLNKSEWTAEEDADILRLHAEFGTVRAARQRGPRVPRPAFCPLPA